MIKPYGVTGLWRGVSVAAIAWCMWACGDDVPPAEALGPDAGVAPGAGAEGGSGGTASTPEGGAGPIAACEPGATQACELDLLCSGVQTCAADGLGFGACECGVTGLVGSGVVGSRCDADADCGIGTCIPADGNVWRGNGGPAGGYCSISCTENADCEAFDSQSYCVPMNETDGMYCIRKCLSKDPDPGEAKCLNRPDLACVSVAAQNGPLAFTADRQDGYCNPRCAVDAECPAGRYCNRNAGRCVGFSNSGAAAGARCTEDEDCEGTCDSVNAEGVGTCTSQCVLGALGGCGYAQDAEPREVACLAPFIVINRFSEGIGDLGLCRELCDVAEDCQRFADGFICSPINAGAAAFFGRPGACAPPPQ